MSVKIFFSYAHEDERLRKRLEKQLRTLKRQGLIEVWHDRNISAGTQWQQEIDQHLNTAHIILLLVSPDFMDSDYSYAVEMKRAIERHERGEARVIPIILRPVDWQSAPFGKYQALPKNDKPVTLWQNRDAAFLDVARGIREVVEELSIKTSINSSKTPMQIPKQRQTHPTMQTTLFQSMPFGYVSTPKPLKPGVRVRHSTYGVGMVLKSEMSQIGEINDVEFQLQDRIVRKRLNRLTGKIVQQYKPGDKVQHDTFGDGVVLKSEMDRDTEFLVVQFAGKHGRKRLSLDFAKLEKL